MKARISTTFLVTLGLLLAGPAGHAVGVDHEDAVQALNRDVYVVVNGALQNPNAETDPAEPLFSEFGAALGFAWGDWRAARASSRAVQIGGPNQPATDFQLRFSGLVPDGVYSVFYGTFGPDSENALCPGTERTIALPSLLGHQLPDRYSFVADRLGSGDFRGRVDGALLDAQQVFISLIWHADGRTYGELPNRGEYFTQGSDCRESYGDDAMRHLVVLQKWS